MKRVIFSVDVQVDLKFWALLPAININLHGHELEFEWLFLGVYITHKDKNPYEKFLRIFYRGK